MKWGWEAWFHTGSSILPEPSGPASLSNSVQASPAAPPLRQLLSPSCSSPRGASPPTVGVGSAVKHL